MSTIVATYPGVYIEEVNGLALSVSSSATSVPVFAVAASEAKVTSVTRVGSWMEYMSLSNGIFDGTNVLDVCMRTYFENGGGYCYLVPTAQLQAEVPNLIEVTTLVAAGQDIQSDVATLCVTGASLFAILDGPKWDISQSQPLPLDNAEDAEAATLAPDPIWGDYGETEFAAIYYPWLTAPKWAQIPIPPSAAMAGVYCYVDLSRGVWKAPANVTLKGGVFPQFPVTDALQGQYTRNRALNMIRVFNNGGTTVWGARTCVDNDLWRYVPVRRLFDTAERDIKAAMKMAMFEPNSQPTWEVTRSAISNYLYKIWKQGGLAGATADEAFFVQVGKDVTMTQTEIDQGMMIVKVGMAAVRPAEFIILQFTQDMAH